MIDTTRLCQRLATIDPRALRIVIDALVVALGDLAEVASEHGVTAAELRSIESRVIADAWGAALTLDAPDDQDPQAVVVHVIRDTVAALMSATRGGRPHDQAE